jgi:Amt family ammonium transporter
MMSWLFMSWFIDKKPSAVGAASGAVAGLVAITPAAGFVGPMPALIIGLGAGVFCYTMVKLLLKLRVDDALAVFGVHGIGGIWGALATGLFVGVGYAALGDGVSRGEQILNQLIGIGASFGWSFVVTGIIMLAIKYTIGLSADEEGEAMGLDRSEHGEAAYEL